VLLLVGQLICGTYLCIHIHEDKSYDFSDRRDFFMTKNVPYVRFYVERMRFFLLKEGSASKTWTNAPQAKLFGLNPDGYSVLFKLILIDDCF